MSVIPEGEPAIVDDLCRRALVRWRLDAFDNVDIAGLLAPARIGREQAGWIGDRLVRNARSLGAYDDGRAILRALRESEDARDAP